MQCFAYNRDASREKRLRIKTRTSVSFTYEYITDQNSENRKIEIQLKISNLWYFQVFNIKLCFAYNRDENREKRLRIKTRTSGSFTYITDQNSENRKIEI